MGIGKSKQTGQIDRLVNSIWRNSYFRGLNNLYSKSISINAARAAGAQGPTFLILDQVDQQLDKDTLPSTLTNLSINKYNQPLLPNVLPKGLKTLTLMGFNQVFSAGVLPSSMTDLSLPNINRQLKPYSLPDSLTHLDIKQYTGSLSFQVLNELSTLEIKHLYPCVTAAIWGTNSITITCNKFSPWINLQQTPIQHLKIHLNSPDRVTLKTEFIPKDIRSLRLCGFKIESPGLIPKSCLYLETDIIDLNTEFIPSTTIHTFYDDKGKDDVSNKI
ncbi:hypothetical protein CYY_007297 [Polysphondylium violaceum]|uniref:FNIP repeat-containing protein n=1 Tax=Polysphondylium violaceum TaxID=133409 RepID=A0A8J4PXP5_9MYCE|nr:hypothetical protein CYY_007297 [Polysphondylium violaceum]